MLFEGKNVWLGSGAEASCRYLASRHWPAGEKSVTPLYFGGVSEPKLSSPESQAWP